MTQASSAARAIEFRNAALGATIAVLHETEPPALADALHKMLGGMPDFFNGEAAVLDFGALAAQPARIDWAGLLSLLRRYQLQPMGVRNLAPELVEGARRAGLALLDGAELRDRQGAAPAAAPTPAPARVEPAPQPAPAPAPTTIRAGTMFIERPLRSGQQVYARGGDLVVLAGVSHGAEVIADGSIHCYGPLRGRALAGAQGDSAARIIATNFGPELVSIAGVYRTFEKGIPEHLAGRAAHVRLTGPANDHKLDLQPLQLD
ncbi:septum site-determining protein MinC [Pseudothauera nasutitermitis]|uniref:Probable septum site-determining protein MinC n=1 Tax=Pseudothauera nasutitermitis TaxID=2565930 RepID=A0A4S4B432_9RHOO|nr:septum site-determining protein MinC [Pseudothauera nasutitermitis]THF67432.1 septum site-determining protein MinC [Pseudothauera nasutitermitis]